MALGDILSNVFKVLIIVVSALAIYYTGLVSIIGAVGFAAAQILGILFLKRIITDNMINIIKGEAMGIKKTGGVILFAAKRFRKDFDGLSGILDLYTKLLWTHFAIVLLIFKYLSSGTSTDVVRDFSIAIVVGVLASFIISPFTLPYWVIYSTRVRILNPKDALIERVGKLLRVIYRSLFGYGNLVVLLVLFIQVVKVSSSFSDAVNSYIVLLSIVLGSIGVASIVTSSVIYFLKKDDINNLLDSFEEGVREFAASKEEALNLLKNMVLEEGEEVEPIVQEEVEVERPVEEDETIEEGTEEHAIVEEGGEKELEAVEWKESLEGEESGDEDNPPEPGS